MGEDGAEILECRGVEEAVVDEDAVNGLVEGVTGRVLLRGAAYEIGGELPKERGGKIRGREGLPQRLCVGLPSFFFLIFRQYLALLLTHSLLLLLLSYLEGLGEAAPSFEPAEQALELGDKGSCEEVNGCECFDDDPHALLKEAALDAHAEAHWVEEGARDLVCSGTEVDFVAELCESVFVEACSCVWEGPL